MSRCRVWAPVALAFSVVGIAACDPAKPFRVLSDARPVNSLSISPDSIIAAVGDTVRFASHAIGAGNREIAEAAVVWVVGNPVVLHYVRAGVFVARTIGTSQATALSGTLRASARVIVR
jgi:hypothetical protein